MTLRIQHRCRNCGDRFCVAYPDTWTGGYGPELCGDCYQASEAQDRAEERGPSPAARAAALRTRRKEAPP